MNAALRAWTAEAERDRPLRRSHKLELSPSLGDRRVRRIGLLGGSFNPAHGGHRHISLQALSHLDLDEVWWLVSPQNPLKPTNGMAPLADRVSTALDVAAHPRIKVTDLETQLGSSHTANTLAALKQRFPRTDFVWIMGADNLRQISRWEKWRRIFQLVPIAVFARPPYSLGSLGGLAAHRFARHRIDPGAARSLASQTPPAWVFFPTRLDPLSATEIRSLRQTSSGIMIKRRSTRKPRSSKTTRGEHHRKFESDGRRGHETVAPPHGGRAAP